MNNYEKFLESLDTTSNNLKKIKREIKIISLFNIISMSGLILTYIYVLIHKYI
jgi:hypothetical protein